MGFLVCTCHTCYMHIVSCHPISQHTHTHDTSFYPTLIMPESEKFLKLKLYKWVFLGLVFICQLLIRVLAYWMGLQCYIGPNVSIIFPQEKKKLISKL